MVAGFDFYGLALATGVLALFGWYFWHVGKTMVDTPRRFAAWLDGRSVRQRAALEHETAFGPAPLWLKAARFAAIASLIALLAVWFWIKMTAA